MGKEPDAPADLQNVLAEELDYILRNRHTGEEPKVVQRSLVGLALSGGGIRSATTNLGILQALAEMRILPMVDYMSTVSGGGYIGACLSALLSWNPNVPPTSENPADAFTFKPGETPGFSTELDSFPFNADQYEIRAPAGAAENARTSHAGSGIIAHLRTHGNFLIAHRGLFRREALRGLGALTIGGLYNALGFLLVMLTASALYMSLILWAAPTLPAILSTPRAVIATDTVRHALVAADSSVVRTTRDSFTCPIATPDCVTRITTLRPTSTTDRITRNAVAATLAFTSQASDNAQSWYMFFNRFLGFPAPIFTSLLFGAIVAIVSLFGMKVTVDRYVGGESQRQPPDAGDSVEDRFERRVLQRATIGMGLTVMLALGGGRMLWNDAVLPDAKAIWLFVPLAVVTGGWLVTFLADSLLFPNLMWWTRRFRSLSSAYYAILSWGWWIMVLFAVAPLIIYALHDRPTGLGLGAVGSLIVTRLLANKTAGTKRFSLPAGFIRTILGLAVLFVLLLGGLFFSTLLTLYAVELKYILAIGAIGIALLFGLGWAANHNKLGPQYFYRDRLSETYLFSELPDAEGRLRVFHDAMEMPLDHLHGESEDPNWKNAAPYHLISAAINLAGSRDLTRKDRKSGYWIFSKLFCGSTHTGFRRTKEYRAGLTRLANAVSISGAAVSSGMGKDTFFAQAFATVLFNLRLGSWLENPAKASSVQEKEDNVFWPLYLLREVLMSTRESATRVNLSDGGHTGDNVGLYPLFQRRCKVIIACDAECDPPLTFSSFTEVLRHAYIDMGIEVDIDLTMIRPAPDTGLSRSHCAVGRIRYPDRPDQESVLIYMKNSLMGDEPETVLNYKAMCSDFPHESTADQFFSDAQFESYRSLGNHIARHTFARWLKGPEFQFAREHHAPRTA